MNAAKAAYDRAYQRQPTVKLAKRLRGRAARATRRAELDQIKLARGCADCGYRLYPEALDFDHLPGTVKLFNVGREMQVSRERLDAEIAKCEVVCANCHRHRTRQRKFGGS